MKRAARDPVEQVSLHRQPAVGEIELAHVAVAFWIGERLQENGIDAQVVDALDQLVEIFGLLLRIGIVEVVEIDVRHPHDLPVLYLRQLLGEARQRRVAGHQHARHVCRRVDVSQPVLQRQRHAVTVLARDVQRHAAGRAVRPDPHARRLTGGGGDALSDQRHVLLDALAIFRLAFVAAPFGVIQPIGDRRFGIALRVGDAAVMRRVGVRADLHQPGVRHFPHLLR